MELDRLVTRLLEGDFNALPRLVSLVEKGDPSVASVMERVTPHTGRAHRIGLTGPPGSGKSTLVETVTTAYRAMGKTVGVLVVDPSSPFTGGAILGDRVRMRDHFLDDGVFIRSMATRGASGGLSAVAPRAVRLLDAAGVDVILLETAGVGQTELDVMHTVDTVVVVVIPEAGDAIQAMKAGLLEIADIFVVNKADRSGAKRMASDLETSVHLGSKNDWWTPPVLQTQAIRGVGIDELVQAIETHRDTLEETGNLRRQRETQHLGEFHRAVREGILARIHGAEAGDGRLSALHRRVEAGELDPDAAADALLTDPAFVAELLRGE